MAAAAAGVIGGYSLSWMQFKGKERNHNRVKICCSSSLMDSYKTLRVQPGASQTEVKKAFRHLALQVGFIFNEASFYPSFHFALDFR